MKKIILSLLVVGALIGGNIIKATDEHAGSAGAGRGAAGGEKFNEAATAELIDAARHGNLDAVKAAIRAGANVNVKDVFDGWTPLNYAAQRGHLLVVEYLLAAGANLNAQNKFGQTALHYAAFRGHLPVVQYLLAAGANLNTQTAIGWTPLHWAAWSGHLPVVQYLITAGADPNAQTQSGHTPLHNAAESGHLPVVECLLSLPAVDLTLIDKEGYNAQALARVRRYHEIADAIKTEIEQRRRWNPLRQGWCGAVGSKCARAAELAVLLAEGADAPTSAAGGGGGGSGAATEQPSLKRFKRSSE